LISVHDRCFDGLASLGGTSPLYVGVEGAQKHLGFASHFSEPSTPTGEAQPFSCKDV
jgi:hypothetical protein